MLEDLPIRFPLNFPCRGGARLTEVGGHKRAHNCCAEVHGEGSALVMVCVCGRLRGDAG
jgi:hypothetical protein